MGALDVPLSVQGVRQAIELRQQLKELPIDGIYVSPLSRTYQTALIALGWAEARFEDDGTYRLINRPCQTMGHMVPLAVDSRLAERSFGDLAGEEKRDYTKRFPKYEGRNVTKSFHDSADGGESFADLEARVRSFVDEMAEQHEGETLLLFSHNGPLRVAGKIFQGLSEAETLSLHYRNCETVTYQR